MKAIMPEKNVDPSWVPRSLLRWVQDPKEDLDLGKKMLEEMAEYTMVLGYNC